MKKIIYWLIGIAIVVGLGYYYKTNQPAFFGGVFQTDAPIYLTGNSATTTKIYLSSIGTAGATATSTVTINTYGVESVDMNLQYVASTTSSNLVWILEFSDNNIDWYNEDVASVAGSVVTHNATATSTPALTMHSWTPGAIGNPQAPFMKNTTITPIASRYMRVSFSSWAANGSLWGEVILKRPTN